MNKNIKNALIIVTCATPFCLAVKGLASGSEPNQELVQATLDKFVHEEFSMDVSHQLRQFPANDEGIEGGVYITKAFGKLNDLYVPEICVEYFAYEENLGIATDNNFASGTPLLHCDKR